MIPPRPDADRALPIHLSKIVVTFAVFKVGFGLAEGCGCMTMSGHERIVFGGGGSDHSFLAISGKNKRMGGRLWFVSTLTFWQPDGRDSEVMCSLCICSMPHSIGKSPCYLSDQCRPRTGFFSRAATFAIEACRGGARTVNFGQISGQ